MRKNKRRALLLAVMLCMTALAFPAFASESGDSITISATGPADILPGGGGGSIDSLTIDSGGDADIPADSLDDLFDLIFSTFGGSAALTPAGNMTLVDDILQNENYSSVENEQKSKQFITVQSKSGAYFYIIIDRSGEQENVYFLNLVDEADLMALLPDGASGGTVAEKPLVCTCEDKCYAGHVDTACAVCAVNMTECTGKEKPGETPAPTVEPATETEPPAEEPEQKPVQNFGGVGAVVLVVALIGGGAFYFIKIRGGKSKPKTKGETDLDDYDYGAEDDGEYAEFPRDLEQEDEPDA